MGSKTVRLEDLSKELGDFTEEAIEVQKQAVVAGMVKSILAWAKRVLQSSAQPPDYDSEVWGLAVGVQKKIEAEGMQPRNVLEKALPKIIANIQQEFRALV